MSGEERVVVRRGSWKNAEEVRRSGKSALGRDTIWTTLHTTIHTERTPTVKVNLAI